MAGKSNIVSVTCEIAELVVNELEYELVDVEYVKEGPNWYLRVYIDKVGGVNIDDCAIVSERISEELDKRDPVVTSYIFEVSSPGLDRPLKTEKDFKRYEGELVVVSLYAPLDGTKVFEGFLISMKDNILEIKLEKGESKLFEMKKVSLVKRAIRF